MKKKVMIVLFLCFAIINVMAKDEFEGVFENYLAAFLSGDYSTAVKLQNEQLTTAFDAEAMKKTAETIVSQYGNPEISYNTDFVEQGQYKIFLRVMKTTKGYIKFTITVNKEVQIAGFYVAPVPDPRKSLSYVNENAFEEKLIHFGEKGWELDAILTLPNNQDSYPIMIIVGGSGPTDMDGTIGPNTPYKDIAEGLASTGIGVMRYNKRTAQHGAKITKVAEEIENMVDFEYIDDITMAIEYASKLENVHNIILAGHSLGGTVVPKVALNSKLVDGLILLAPGVRRLAQISLDQNRYVKDYLSITDEQMAQVEEYFTKILNQELPEDLPIQAGMTVGYYYDMDKYSPKEDLSVYEKPVLVLQGEEDFQATMEGDYLPLKEKYDERENFTFVSYPGLNHLMMITESGVFHWVDEYNKPGFVDEEVIDTLKEWINRYF